MNTTVSEMKRLKKGDKFTVYNEEHIAYSDAHQSDDSSYEEFLDMVLYVREILIR